MKAIRKGFLREETYKLFILWGVKLRVSKIEGGNLMYFFYFAADKMRGFKV